ncbi:MAG: hypothetical protein ACE5NG_13520 [bacterium]
MLHGLLKGFFKIRYYGILATKHREKLRICQEILAVTAEQQDEEIPEKSFEEWFFELTGMEPGICPYCKGRLIRKSVLQPVLP